MRYEDTSGSVHSAAGNADARDDADTLANGSNGPASGNVITGAGTTTGKAGADAPATGHVVAVHGAGGTDSSTDGASLHVDGRYGTLVIDEHGNYKYVADGHAPASFRDLFQYTLADSKGGQSVADLVISRGGEIKVSENAQQIVPGPDGVVTLPAGVDLSDVHVVGRNLVVDMPDGSQIVIVNGAVFVPQLVLGGVEVPSTNLAALLIDSEPRPAAGPPPSSGGDFADPVPPLDPGVPLGDLIPPTELTYNPPEFKPEGGFIDKHPEAGTVSVQLDDDDVPGKNGNPGGPGDDAGAANATTSGNLPGSGGDGALTWDLSSAGAPAGFSYVDGPNGSVLVQQVQGGNTVTVLTITIDAATGAYTVTENAPILHPTGDNENNVSFTINYTVTDQDGDTAPGTLNINVDDDTPTVSVTAGSDAEVSLTTHDALTPGAGSEAVSTTANFSGVFGGTSSSPGADGAGAGSTDGYALSTTGGASGLFSHGVAINLYNVGGVIVGSTSTTAPATATDASVVFSVSTTNTGIVTLTQYQQIDHTADPHPTGAPFTDDIMSLTDGSITLTRSVTVVDKDGDSVTGSASVQIGANLHFVDDGPTIGLADRGEPNLVVDETDLSVNATANFAANFSASFGADGPAANSITYALGISAAGADSGLKDVATGSAIVLVQNGAVVEGHVGDANGALAFTVSVNAAGDVTLDQIRAVVHPDANNPDTDETVTLSADNLVTLTATAHDFDGDTASSTINIGTNLIFHDDGPTAAIGTTGQTVSLDETVGVQGDSNDVAGPLAVFAGVANKGVDPDMATQFATNANAIVNSTGTVFGADGGTAVFSLNVSSAGVDSGLNTTDGHNILLTKEGDLIVGRVSGGADDGKAAFAISIDSTGHISMVEWLSIQHPNTGSADESVSIANGAVLAVVTATDNDGDFSTASTAIGGLISFQDDGPTAAIGTTGQTVSLDETVGVQGDSNDVTGPLAVFAGVANKGVDPDMATQFAANANAVVNSTGTAFGADGAGTAVFSLNVSSAGVDSGLNTTDGHDILLTLENGIVVGRVSGGADDGKAAFAISIDSTGHISMVEWLSIQHPNTGNPDDSLSIANGAVLAVVTATDGDGDTSVASTAIGGLLSFQDDGPSANNDTDVTSNITDMADGNVITGVGTTEGSANHDSPGADGFGSITNLVGFNGSTDGNATGGFDVNGQFGTLHMDASGNYTYTRTSGGGGATDTFTYTYVDGDGDPVSATLTITLADNTPVAGTVNVGLDDDALAGGNAGGIGDDPNSVNATGNLPGSGGDAPLTFGVLLTGAPAGFTYVSGGAGIVLVQQGGVTVLTVTVDSTTGAYSVVQNAPITHAAGGDENNQNFTITYTVTDVDTDVANGSINISVDDDTPTVSANAGVQLDDDALAGGNAGGIGDDANATNTSGTLAHSYGADGAGSIAYLTTGAPAGFSYALQGNGDLWVMQGATHVLTLTVNASTGAYTVTQVAAIDHAAGGDENNVSFTISYNVTDHDGDSATGSIVVNVDDDTPTVSANTAVQLDDDALAGGNAGGIGDVNPDTANTSGTLAHSYGADGAGSMAYLTTGAPAGFTYALQGNGDLWIMQGATHVITLTVNASTGAYTVTQVAPIDHPAGSDENDVSFTVSYNVTDHDGDTATGSIVINVDDDTPTVSANAAVQLDDDALAGGNAGGIGDVNPDTANTSGTLGHSFGADGAGSMAYLTTGAPAGFTYALQGNGDLWVMQGATHVITLTLNSSTGAYTVTQVAPIDHPAGSNENDVSFTISYNVTDHDGDSATGSIVINVDDDTPTVSANAAVQLDDDALAGGNAGGIGDVNPDTANTSGTLAHSYGADGAGSIAYLTTGAPAGFTYALQGNGDLWVMQGATHVITLTVNASTGAYTVTQVAPIAHAAGGDENDQSFTISYNVSDHDGDTATGSIVINVDDDTPTATIVATGANTSLDESVGVQSDSNDTISGTVSALFAGVTNVGSDTDLAQYATNASAIVASTGSSYGADGAGTTTFSLNVSSAGVDSGLNTTDGHDILLFKEGNLIVGRVSGGADDGKAAFAIAIDNTGHISTVEYLSIQHPDGTNPDDMVSILNSAVTATVTLTDSDGDPVSSTPLAIGSHIQFQDSGPVMVSAQNINIQNSGDVAHTGAFSFNLGADGANITTNDVITNVTGSATVGGLAVQNWTLTPGAESATTASYSFSFDYGIGGGNTAHETGTLVFDKIAGTYTVDLANPIQGVTTILQTATGTLFQGYEFGTSTPDGSQPAISVTQIQDLAGTANDIYVQFTSVAEPSSGTGDNNLEFSNWVPGADNPAPINGGGDTTWNPGQLFNQTDSWVSTSNDANGVAGDTIQGGEVLDFNLVQGANPTGTLADPSTYAQASSMFLKFDGIGSSEDMIVVLKLYDTVAHTYTTVALMVQNSDIQKGPGTGPGIYSGITLDQNDGLIVIEPNDYQQGNTNLVIVGAQIAGSDEGLSGSAIDFTYGGTLGVASTGTQAFSTDVSDGPFKISSIGFTSVSTTPQNAQLDFNITVTDGDGDSITQAITATVTPAADSTSAATIPAANTTVAPVVLDLNGDGVHFLGTDAGVHYDYGSGSVATAWASPQDGILVLDANHNGTVDNASEFVFGGGSVTDLQALAALDTNGDGQLTAADANFATLGVWQDANSNGVVDAGEYQTLTARGISAISLSTDGVSYTAAGGDAIVSGTGSYTNADGTSGSLADAAFVIGSRTASNDLRTTTSLSSNAALVAALAAAGLEASDALTAASSHAGFNVGQGHGLDTAGQHTQALSPVALDAVSGHSAGDLMPSLNGSVAGAIVQSTSHSFDQGLAHGMSLTGAFAQHSQGPSELIEAMQTPAHDSAAFATATGATSVMMPAAQQLAGVAGDAGAQHNQVIGQVLADALHGGGGQSSIDGMLSTMPSQGGHAFGLALASGFGAGVPNGDSGGFGDFTAVQSTFTMEHMMIAHQVAALAHG